MQLVSGHYQTGLNLLTHNIWLLPQSSTALLGHLPAFKYPAWRYF